MARNAPRRKASANTAAAAAAAAAASNNFDDGEDNLDEDLGDGNADSSNTENGATGGTGAGGGGDEQGYCYCGKPSYGEMIGCDGETCKLEWVRFRSHTLYVSSC